MAFKGDLSTIGLAEVFQMISMSRKEGTLVVQDARSRKCIFFGLDGIQVLSTGRRKVMRIGDLLVRMGKLSEARLQQVLLGQLDGKLLGEVLVERKLVTTQDIEEAVRWQIEEEIYDLFIWRSAAFEFIEGPPADELKDPQQPVTRLNLDVNGLLLEAVRRIDEWGRIHERIQGEHGVLRFLDESTRWDTIQASDERIHKILHSIDGVNTVGDIIERTGLPKFDVCRTLVELLDAGKVSLLEGMEIVRLADQRIDEGRTEAGFRLYEAALAQHPEDAELMSRYARALERGEDALRAADEYTRLGRQAREQGDIDATLRSYQRAVALDPKNLARRLLLWETHLETGDNKVAAELGLELGRLYLETGDTTTTRRICQSMIAVGARTADFRILLAKVHHQTGSRSELEEELRNIQRNLPSDRAEADRVLREIGELLPGMMGAARADAPARRAASRPRRSGNRTLQGILTLGLLLLLGAAGYALKYEMGAREAYAFLHQEAQQALREKRFPQAQSLLSSFEQGEWRYSFLTVARMKSDLRKLEQQIAEQETERKTQEARQWEQATAEMTALDDKIRTGFESGNLDQAQKDVDRLRELSRKFQNGEFLQKADAHGTEILRYLAEASRLGLQAEEFIRQKKYVEAAKQVKELRTRFGNSPVARNTRYTLFLRIRPASGVSLRVNRIDMGVVEKGERELKIDGGEKISLFFTREGYRVREIELKDPAVGELEVVLDEKTDRWTLPDAGADAVLGVWNGQLLISSRGELVALHPGSRSTLWRESIPGGLGPSGISEGWILISTMDKRLYAFDPGKPKGERVVWEITLPARLRTPAVLAPDLTTVYAACEDRTVYAYSMSGRSELFRVSPGCDVPHPPALDGDRLLIPGGDGVLYSFAALSGGDPQWKYSTGSGITGTPALQGGVAYLGASDGRVHAVTLLDGSRRWVTPPLAGEISGTLCLSSGLAVAPCRDGRVYSFALSDGSLRWSFAAEGPVSSTPVAQNGTVCFGSDDKNLYRMDLVSGRLLWRYPARNKVRGTPVISDGILYFAAHDGSLYAVQAE